MKLFLRHILCFFLVLSINAQEQYHVFPKQDVNTPGSSDGNGSLTKPWDLQTALLNESTIIKPGDTLWLHAGVYNGRYVSTLAGDAMMGDITVSAFNDEIVILNGNIPSNRTSVLEIKGGHVVYKNFEITWLGEFSRDQNDMNFQVCSGIRHLTGVNCKFYNLKIHDNPGLGIGSWKHAAGSVIENCMIYNNGFIAKNAKGRGEGIYVQNKSDAVRLIKDNIIYNNYYKGIEVWSAGKRATTAYVKNIRLEGNIIFNSGSPSGKHFDNVIIASDDRNGINLAQNIAVVNNIFYHNTIQPNGNLIGNAPSLTIGYNKKAPPKNITVTGNIITGGYNGLRLLYAHSLAFTNNKVYTGIVQLNPEIVQTFSNWEFSSNTFYSKRLKPFRVRTVDDYSLAGWKEKYGLGERSKLKPISEFVLHPVVKVIRHDQQRNTFTLALFNEESNAVVVDFSEYDIPAFRYYKVYDVENLEKVLLRGQLNFNKQIKVPLNLIDLQKPSHNSKAKKTLTNFGVYLVKFDAKENDIPSQQPNGFFKRFFKWLGL